MQNQGPSISGPFQGFTQDQGHDQPLMNHFSYIFFTADINNNVVEIGFLVFHNKVQSPQA